MPKKSKEPKVEIVDRKSNEKSEKNEVQLVSGQDMAIESIILRAIDKGTPVETMERILAMRRDLKAEAAKEAFDDAMAAFQAECPIIKKDKKGGETKSGKTAYMYAPLDLIVAQVREPIKRHGFSYMIKTKVGKNESGEKVVKSTCAVKHRMGHSEESSLEVPIGQGTNIMSPAQVVAAASTFSKRYAFINAFGIMTGDEDNDGQTLAANQDLIPITKFQEKELKELLEKSGFKGVAGIKEWEKRAKTKLSELTQDRASKFIEAYQQRENQKNSQSQKEPFPDKPKGQSRSTAGNPVTYRCTDCQKEITKAEHDYSQKNYGIVLCRECQKNYKKKI